MVSNIRDVEHVKHTCFDVLPSDTRISVDGDKIKYLQQMRIE